MRYRLTFKAKVLNYALKYNGNHAASVFNVPHSVVYRWLRDYGFETAIGKYFRKGYKVKAVKHLKRVS